MAYVLIFFALIALVGAVALFMVDSRQRRSVKVPHPEEGVPDAPEESLPQEEVPSVDVEESEPAPEPVQPELPVVAVEPALPEPEHPSDPTPEGEGDVEKRRPESTRYVAHRSSGLQLPGANRRERKAWAEERGYEFTRADDYLVDEWIRGAAASGAPVRDIVSGFEYGHEMLFVSLGGVNVMAMRTGGSSDVVADFIREGAGLLHDSDDLVPVEQVSEFNVFGSDAEAVRRMIDVRVATALETLPNVVTAVWMESDWVLAQTVERSRAEEWEKMLAPLAMLADAARVLPPRSSAGLHMAPDDFTPTRVIPSPVDKHVPVELRAVPSEPTPEAPRVKRPEEPIQLPTRAQSELRGVVAPRSLGGDEVDAIADGRHRIVTNEELRILRDPARKSTLFDGPDSMPTDDGH